MNKNKLLQIAPINGAKQETSEYIGKIRILTAQIKVVDKKRVLNIDVYERDGLKARFFYTNKKHIAYELHTEKWTEKAFKKVLDGDYCSNKSSYAYRFLSSDMRKKTEKFFFKFSSEDKDMIETIASYEDHCNAIKAQKRQKKKEAIERAEKHICNPIPRRMKTWLFQRLPVYFMQKNTGETTCTSCNKTFQMDLKKHLSDTKCPYCKKMGQVQRLNRCKHWFYHNVWGMLWDINKAGEQVVRYVYSSYRIVVNKKEQSFVMEPWYGGELARVYYDRPVSRANFEAPYGRKWTMSTKHYLSSGGLFLKHDYCGYCYFYPYNQNEWVKEITADKIGTWTYFIFDLSKPERRNFYERLAKVNLGDLARDFIFSYMDPIRSIDLNNTNLLDNLNLNKNTLRILKSCPTIAAWQFLKEVPDITQEKFDKWTKLFGYSAREYNRFKNPMKVCGYACSQNQEDKKGFLNSYINYLDIIEEYGNELGINLKSKSVKYPSDFTKADANLTRDYQELMKKKKAEKEAFFDKNYAAMTEELKAAMCKSKDIKKFLKGTSGLLVKIPETREELIKEGNRLHNCLATYADKMAAGKTTIFFIRKIDDPDKEYFAMEYRDGEIKQLYTYHNHRDESGKVVAFADAFAAMLKESNFEPPKLAA